MVHDLVVAKALSATERLKDLELAPAGTSIIKVAKALSATERLKVSIIQMGTCRTFRSGKGIERD